MEEYVREAPRMVPIPTVALEYPERLMLTYKQEDVPQPSEETKVVMVEPVPPPPPTAADVPISSGETEVPPHPPANLDIVDLLCKIIQGWNVPTQDASAIEESNALSLAIVPSGNAPAGYDAYHTNGLDLDPTGWELALVSTPGANLSSAQERQLAGGLDSLTLGSLYDEGVYRASQQQAVYGAPAPNPFEDGDGFRVDIASEMLPQIQNNNPFGSFESVYPEIQQQQQQHLVMSHQNPFGDTGLGATTNPFGL